MHYFDHKGEIEITGADEFDLVKTFECGQCFRWNADENGRYTGVAFGSATRLRRNGGSVFISCSQEDFENIWRGYFDLDRDYSEIRRGLCIDDYMSKACGFGAGIRLLKQDKWEALCSFIISQCNNIPRIKKIVSSLCFEFGDRFECRFAQPGPGESAGVYPNVEETAEFYTFPSAARLAALTADDLAPIRCGYRAAYIINAAKAITGGEPDLDALSRGAPDDARAALKKLHGVGSKVADCAVLFGLHMLDSFPLDVWMKRAVAEHYGSGFDPSVFSPYAGLAQQYMYYYARSQG